MKALLMHVDQDFDLQAALPRHEEVPRQDLELDTVLHAMAGDNGFLLDVAWKALLSAMQNDSETILYRQEMVRDSLKNPAVVRELYALAVELCFTSCTQETAELARAPPRESAAQVYLPSSST